MDEIRKKTYCVNDNNETNDLITLIKAEEALRIHKILFEIAQDIILYIGLDGQIIDFNQRAYEKYGYTKQQLLSMKIQDLRHPSTASEYERQMQQADTSGVVFECVHVKSDGTSFPVEVSAKSTLTENGPLRIHIVRDITERKEQEAKINWLARYDALTGIQNRASFVMQLEQEIHRSIRNKTLFAVMLFDIDKFKHINDYYGHEAGDIVLRQVATRVHNVLRTTDQIGRLGGDEFVILQTDIKKCDDIISLIKRIEAVAGEQISYKENNFKVSISIGVCLFPEEAKDIDSLLHCADKAMYKVKKSGGGNYSFFTCCEPPCSENSLCVEKV